MYKCLSNEGPAYLTRDLVPVASLPEKQRLRSGKSKDVVPNKHKLKSLGLRRFSVSGPKLWNNLPNSLKSSSSTKSFCRSLKTYSINHSLHHNNNTGLFKKEFIFIFIYLILLFNF